MKTTIISAALLASSISLSGNVSAAMVWIPGMSVTTTTANSAQFLTIESYRFFWNGYNSILTVKFKEPISTGCAGSDNNRHISHWTPSTSAFEQSLLSIVITAKTLNQKVRVEYDNTICDAGAGRMLYGIEPVILE